MDTKSVQRNALTDEMRRTILRESLNRYRNELLPDEERMLLQDRINRMRRALGVLAR